MGSSASGDSKRTLPSASQVVNRQKRVNFRYNGRTVAAYEGDTAASALYASGVRIFSRSFKYHRPRGLLCVSGRCPNCLMNVDGVPNIRVCTEPVREGMSVKSQNSWPSPDHDFFSIIDRLDRFLPVGFYYKTFINPPIEWKRVEGIIRRLTGTGSIEEELAKTSRGKREEDGRDGFEHLHIQADVTVVGAGPAGIYAALEASSLGARVILVDDQPAIGGHLCFSNEIPEIDSVTGEAALSGKSAFEVLSSLSTALHERANIRVLTGSSVFGAYESNLVGIFHDKTLTKLRTNQLIMATGAHEFPAVFQNNDRPGIFLGRGLQRLVNLYGVIPGKQTAVFTNNPTGLEVAKSLRKAGVELVAYVDPRANLEEKEITDELGQEVPVFLGYAVKAANGSKRLRSIVLIRLDEQGNGIPGTEKEVMCDLLALSNGFETEAWLMAQTGSKSSYDEELREFVPGELKEGVLECGEVTGLHDLNITILQGKLAGITAALKIAEDGELGPNLKIEYLQKQAENYKNDLMRLEKSYRTKLLQSRSPEIVSVDYAGVDSLSKRFVCICEDVAVKDITLAAFEGFDDIETLKRYSTATMGPCQGKMCSIPSVYACAKATGKSIQQTGRTVSRPPYVPVPMGTIAGAELNPVRLTPTHYKHLDLGARMMDMGEWKRPFVYSSVKEEYAAVREAVGIIDVSTLGRLDLKGKDAGKLLDFVYTHIFSTLKVGKSRYGVICDDAGIILDDGTVTKLSEDHYFITTTTGNAEFVEQWLEWWSDVLRLDAQLTNVTAGLAAVNVAGPRARDLLRKLTDIDLSAESFPYMNSGEGLVAGVPCILLRIGFVGETGWEIHFPAEYGEYFWDALTEVGKDLGVKPFGVETQRVLRLDKKHVIVGQDTDALSNPSEADMAWVVKFEKEDFVGRAALLAAQEKEGTRKLVGFVVNGPASVHDGDQVYSPDGVQRVGFVTSSRFSPHVNRWVGMALVAPEYHKDGEKFKVKTEGAFRDAAVVLAAFYDPEGKRLRS